MGNCRVHRGKKIGEIWSGWELKYKISVVGWQLLATETFQEPGPLACKTERLVRGGGVYLCGNPVLVYTVFDEVVHGV